MAPRLRELAILVEEGFSSQQQYGSLQTTLSPALGYLAPSSGSAGTGHAQGAQYIHGSKTLIHKIRIIITSFKKKQVTATFPCQLNLLSSNCGNTPLYTLRRCYTSRRAPLKEDPF